MLADEPELPAIGITWPGGLQQQRATVSGNSLLYEVVSGGPVGPIATYDLTAPITDTLGELASAMTADSPNGAIFNVGGLFDPGDAATLLVDQVVTWSTFSTSPLVAVAP